MKKIKVICEISNKHCHLTESELQKASLTPTKLRDVSQPGQWVSNEYYNDGTENFRIVMPARKENQFELSLTDWIRRFGKEKTPQWKSRTEPGYVVTLRHMHVSIEQAKELGLNDGDKVSLEVGGIRAGRLDNILVRVADKAELRVHLDTDEGNALYVKNGDLVDVVYEENK